MKKLLSHLIIPLAILVSGLFVYYTVSPLVSSLVTEPEQIAKLEKVLIEQPERAVHCAVPQLLESKKLLNSVLINLENALFNFLFGGTFGLFLVAVARELYVYNKLRENS